jgi:hypothetical protein
LARDNAAAMIYRFKSKACADLIMLGPHGDQMLRLLGREPARQGIIETDALPAALAALQRAADAQSETADGDESPSEPVVTLRQRLWPVINMLREAHEAGHAVVWGV